MAQRPSTMPHLTGDDLQDAILRAARCKAMRSHRFDAVGPIPGTPRPDFGTIITYRCEHCGTYRFDKVSRITGERVAAPTYQLPDWYADAGSEWQETAWWRSMYYQTLELEVFLEPETTNVRNIKKSGGGSTRKKSG